MAENKDLKLTAAQHELDENKNPSSLNFSSSISTVNDSFNCESEKKYLSESQNIPDDALISAGLSTPKKNALIDSGFHCENLEKAVIPDLVNNSLCESVDNELNNGLRETKQILITPGVSFCSINDNSFDTCHDASFNVSANTTSNNIALLFERLTLNSDGNSVACNDLENSPPLEASALPEKIFNDNLEPSEMLFNQPMPGEVSLNENFRHPNLSNVPVDTDGSKLESSDISVSSATILQLPSPVPEPNKVFLDETFTAPNQDVPLNTDEESLSCSASKITNPDCPFSSKPSLNDTFKSPLPVPESCDLPNIQNISDDNVFVANPDYNFDGEEFQDAVQFFKDPSSFQVFENIATSNTSGTNVPRDSLYMTFDPFYKRIVKPADVASGTEEICDGAENNQFVNKHVPTRESLCGNLVSFDSPIKDKYAGSSEIKVEELNIGSVKTEICSVDSVENDQQCLNKHPSNVLAQESLVGNLVSFGSPIKINTAGISEKENGALGTISVKNEISNNQPLNSSLKSFSVGKSEEESGDLNKGSVKQEFCGNQPFSSPMKSNSEKENEDLSKSVNYGISDVNHAENDQQFVNKHILQVPARESLGGNLLSFDSPMKSNSARNSEIIKASSLENDQKLYTEEELQQALKIFELTMQETYLKRQKELEEGALKKQTEMEGALKKEIEDALKKQKETEDVLKNHKEMEETCKKQKETEEEALRNESETTKKLHQVTEFCKVLLDTVSEFATITSEQNTKIGDLSARVITLETENQKLDSDLKTSNEDLQSVEHTFSDFHKRYVQCKDMLKTYKDNEDRLRTQMESLNTELEEQQQMYSMLQVKMGEMVDKANAEVATAKKGGDAQIAVLKAQLKKSELKVSSLESDLKQVRIENDKLSNICDDLMAKVSES